MEDMLGYFVFIGLIQLVCSGIMAGYFREAAELKGYEGDRFFWLPFLFTIAGYLYIIALPDKNMPTRTNKTGSEDELPDL